MVLGGIASAFLIALLNLGIAIQEKPRLSSSGADSLELHSVNETRTSLHVLFFRLPAHESEIVFADLVGQRANLRGGQVQARELQEREPARGVLCGPFAHANLDNADLKGPTSTGSSRGPTCRAPTWRGANLTGANLTGPKGYAKPGFRLRSEGPDLSLWLSRRARRVPFSAAPS